MYKPGKLGKRSPSKKDSVSFGDFLTTLPTTPLVDFAPNYTYPMDLNDQYGDCVVAGFDHFRQVVSGLLTGTQQNFTQDEIIAFYKTQNPNFPSEDNGMDIQTFLEYLVAQKYILGFAKIDYTNEAELRAATYLGLSIITGVQLRNIQMQQFETGTWDYVATSPIDGGHCIPLVGYNSSPDIVDIVSWGKLIAGTQNFVLNQMDEAWFVLTQAHVDHPNFRDNFDLAGFSQAVSEITSGKVVIPVPPPKPPQPVLSVVLTRTMSDLKETTGTFITSDNAFSCLSLELPWLNNQPNISCIPTGTYNCVWTLMPRENAYHYELQNVPGRSGIFIHAGNFYTDTLGCILLGGTLQDINKDGFPDLLNSEIILEAFEMKMNKQPFTLQIK